MKICYVALLHSHWPHSPHTVNVHFLSQHRRSSRCRCRSACSSSSPPPRLIVSAHRSGVGQFSERHSLKHKVAFLSMASNKPACLAAAVDCALYASEWVNILFVGITKAVLQLQIGLRGEVAAMVGVQGRFEEVHDLSLIHI